jgi:hypothetical protein
VQEATWSVIHCIDRLLRTSGSRVMRAAAAS